MERQNIENKNQINNRNHEIKNIYKLDNNCYYHSKYHYTNFL